MPIQWGLDVAIPSLGPSWREKALSALAPGMTSVADQGPKCDGLSPYVFWIHLTDSKLSFQ